MQKLLRKMTKHKLSKVVIPIAGLGTRMLPATKAIPKEMLPIAGKPIIQHIVEEASLSGFSEIILITHSSKYSVENHFDTSFELEAALEKRVKRSLLKEIKNISKLNVNISSLRQGEAKGLGHAILCAKPLLNKEPFAVMLPDMIIDINTKKSNLYSMKNEFEKSGQSSVLLGAAKKSEISKYGIAKIARSKNSNGSYKLENIIEKPTPKRSPSNLFAAGRYIFTNEILDFLSSEKPDSTGEIQLTGAISNFLNLNPVQGFKLEGKIFDCGDKLGYLIANLAFSFNDPSIKKEVLKFINK